MTLCPECGAMLRFGNPECWSCGSALEVRPNEESDSMNMRDWLTAILMLAVPLLAYFIVFMT